MRQAGTVRLPARLAAAAIRHAFGSPGATGPAPARCSPVLVTAVSGGSTGDRQQLGGVNESCLGLQGGRAWEVGTPAPGLCPPP